MLRAGPLSTEEVLDRLEEEFVNAWILRQDLDPLIAREDDAEVARAAKAVADAYSYPVDSLVLSSGGEVLGQLEANGLGDDPAAEYAALLDCARPAPR